MSNLLPTAVDSLSHEELLEEHKRMERAFQKLVDNGKQQIYELQRSLSASTATQEYLSAELECLQGSRDAEVEGVRKKFAVEIEKLKDENARLCGDRSNLEREMEELGKKMTEQQKHFELKLAEKESDKLLNNSKNDTLERDFEAQIADLTEKNADLERQVRVLTHCRHELEHEREELREKVTILENRSQGQAEEIEEKVQLIEELQVKLFEINTEMLALKNDPNAMNRKGNSLFAEVDDQRQKMKSILAAQSKKYNEMKAAYKEGQREIKRLKQENSEIAEEFRYIKNMFVNADASYRNQLMAQIGDHRREIVSLREKIAWTEEKLNETAKNQGVHWTDELMKYCNNQVAKVETNLKTVVHQKNQLEENAHRMQQELAKLRYKCLKYKCALINRELLLEECGMEFPEISDIPINPTVEVDIDNFEDTFEPQVNPSVVGLRKKPPKFPILEDTVLENVPEEEGKENAPSEANKIIYRDINFPPPSRKIEKPVNSPVAVYLDSNAETTSTDNLPGGDQSSATAASKHPSRTGTKNTHITIKKIVLRK